MRSPVKQSLVRKLLRAAYRARHKTRTGSLMRSAESLAVPASLAVPSDAPIIGAALGSQFDGPGRRRALSHDGVLQSSCFTAFRWSPEYRRESGLRYRSIDLSIHALAAAYSASHGRYTGCGSTVVATQRTTSRCAGISACRRTSLSINAALVAGPRAPGALWSLYSAVLFFSVCSLNCTC